MPMKRLLVCVDGSANSEEAVRYAADIARKCDSTISLMYVWIPPASAEQEMDVPDKIPALELECLRGAVKILDDAGVRYQVIEGMGNPADEILDESSKGYGLAVLGNRGLGGVERFLLGSVTSKVSHHIKIPMMIVPPRGESGSDRSREAIMIP